MTPAFISSMVATVVPTLQPIVKQIETLGRMAPAQQAAIDTAMGAVRDSASAVSGAESTAAALPLAKRVQADANAVLTIIGGLPLPPPIGLYVAIGSGAVMSVFGIINTVMDQHAAVQAAQPQPPH